MLAAIPLLMLAAVGWAAEGKNPSFSTDILPIFSDRCVRCHGPDKAKEGLRLDTLAAVLKGSERGPVVTSGKPETSTLLKLVSLPAEDGDRMPPKGDRLSADQLARLRQWIAAGLPE